MNKPTKGDLRANAEYLKEWDDFQRDYDGAGPILLPISIGIEDGMIKRDRLKKDAIEMRRDALVEEFTAHCDNIDGHLDGAYTAKDFDSMLGDYITAFAADGSQGPRPPSPLDFKINRPVWFLFYLPQDNWVFTDNIQYSVENDRDDFTRNFEKVCTLDNNNILVLANHCRSNPPGLKYNLHITISQQEGGKTLCTDIIIDPDLDNGDRDGAGGGTGGGTTGGGAGGGSGGGTGGGSTGSGTGGG